MRRNLIPGAVLLLVLILLIPFALRSRSRQPARRIDLTLVPMGENMLCLTWSRSVPASTNATSALLHIADGGHARDVVLDREQLANGFLSYRPGSDDVTFRLQIRQGAEPVSFGSIRFLGGPPALRATPVCQTGPANPKPELRAALVTEPRVSSAVAKPKPDTQALAAEPHEHRAVVASSEPVRTAGVADRRTVREGLARFVVKTPGTRIIVRRTDVPDSSENAITSDAVRLPEGRWIYHASAPGFEPATGAFLVNSAGPADIFIRLQPRSAYAR